MITEFYCKKASLYHAMQSRGSRVIAVSQQKDLPEIYVEKDYWVTLALFHILKNNIGKEAVFKDGTALSKCFGMIQRFSEDVDLVVLKKESETENHFYSKIK